MTPRDELATQIRRAVIEQSKRAHVGHIGSALSIADILASLYGGTMNRDADEDRDRLVLSKGHAALALYAALRATGEIDQAELETYCADASAFGGHPEHVAPGVDFSTGSLGHGLSIGAGAALAARHDDSRRRVFVVMSDAELNEGSVWEAAMFAAHHGLANLIAIVDDNAQQALGATAEIIDLQPSERIWEAFGWDTQIVEGHDPDALSETIADLNTGPRGRPHVLIAKTTFGKGVSFMESQVKWHYWPMDDEQYGQALREVGTSA